ncbi:MAG: flagellin, partial [Burkholderiaceae bacterium]
TLNSAMQRVDAVYNNVLSVRASAGTRMNEVTALDSAGGTRILEYRNQLSQLEDLDYYTAITQLQLRTTALEAASMAFQKIQNISLFNLNSR